MLKLLKAMYVYGMYIIMLPLVLAFSIAFLTYMIIQNKRDFGKFDVIWSIKQYVEGMRIGHMANKCFIDGCTIEEYCDVLNS